MGSIKHRFGIGKRCRAFVECCRTSVANTSFLTLMAKMVLKRSTIAFGL
ncbi:hypothetical protein HBZC1_p0080 (plasmid) [Helicobacter bizzozeronii CIII-1]|uniref:Uncharacterized protein n=1 Tax=Helicobacter bizzozeronii (strain CIII-1) TaxID=1002804 RepID=F8KUF3_HELBC|nr:hypothetical protein HBZC1_p0080 [Helicobacter bizzozeronii CIII-1]